MVDLSFLEHVAPLLPTGTYRRRTPQCSWSTPCAKCARGTPGNSAGPLTLFVLTSCIVAVLWGTALHLPPRCSRLLAPKEVLLDRMKEGVAARCTRDRVAFLRKCVALEVVSHPSPRSHLRTESHNRRSAQRRESAVSFFACFHRHSVHPG
jgi:hypothetical protein